MFETEGKIIKIILIGDTGAGKTSLLTRFAEDAFNNFFIPTIGVDFRTRDIMIDGEQVKLHLWDITLILKYFKIFVYINVITLISRSKM